MQGIIRIRVDGDAPRSRIERIETIGGVRFQTALLHMRSEDGMLDNLMLRQSVRLLALRGVTRVAAPDTPYMKSVLARYHIDVASHTALLRALAPRVLAHVLRGTSDSAVLLYARGLDSDVLSAARYAAQHSRQLVLDFGARGEAVRRRLMDETGAAALLDQVGVRASKTAVLLFDRPHPTFRVRLPHPVTVSLYEGSAPGVHFDDAHVAGSLYEPLGDTDREGVLSMVVSHDRAACSALEIVDLIKK